MARTTRPCSVPGKREVPRRPGDDRDVVEIVDPARLDGGAPARIGTHDLVGARRIFARDDGLDARNGLQAIDPPGGEIGDRLPRLVWNPRS